MAAEGTAERLSAYLHVLRATVHLGLGWLPSEPRLDAKRALGRHAHEDARSVTEILTRLGDLPHTHDLPGAPAGTLRDVLARLATARDVVEYRRLAYGSVKPALAQLLRDHRNEIDPLLDEPTLELVTLLLSRQARHVEELLVPDASPLTFAPRVSPGGEAELPPVAAPERPARDPWIEEGVTDDPLHHALASELVAAEVLARASHDRPDLPWALHADIARLVADRLRHTAALEAAGARWGDAPADTAPYAASSGAALGERLRSAHDLARVAADAHPPLEDDLAPLARAIERWRDTG